MSETNSTFDVAVPHTRVQMAQRIGALGLDVDFALTKPWTVLFGPSGAGKTTLLRAIAGLERPERGRILCAGAVLLDSTEGRFVPAHLRKIPLASQHPNLFPNLTVAQNLAYSGRNSAAADLHEALDLTGVLHRLPGALSGGEAQRVNLARAICTAGSRLLLLDEPFTGMDRGLRDVLLPWLQRKLADDGVPVLSVTHDAAEAFQLGAEVIQIADGKVVAQGEVGLVLAEERSRLLTQLNGTARTPA